jgi:hypothetical protein
LERFVESGDPEVLLEGLPDQVQLRNDVTCALCGRHDGLFIQYGDRMMCVDCVTKENGEDDPHSP